jgi:hypothetical protein
MSKTHRALLIIAAVVAGAVILAALVSCQGYQPPGQDLWLALPRK